MPVHKSYFMAFRREAPDSLVDLTQVDARLNAQPVRAPIRPGINAVPAFLAVDVGDLDVGVSDEIAFVDEIQFVDEMPDPVPEPAAQAAPQAAAADTSSVNELYSR